ncbi:MAG: acyltransferase [Chryseobacterium sp.]|uniref:acyltransferase family protein n=1 Tax=Chryseobacterium sp. TaxID=1871047 RepID=UPI0025C27BB0|nr:acyltransferase family protein [Chryseobacterium sp.]MCJ7934068.1 acyltransferase [Chryseobacterium sp.]
MQFRNDIQGIRALAFFLVFLFHLNYTWLQGGFIGVDVFFVISGYLMTSIIVDQKDRNSFSFFDFYWKRLKRIFPAYLFLIIAATLAGSFVYLGRDIWTLQKSAIASIIFLSNLLFSRGDSYFGAQLNENPFLHTWSLAIEMQFYLLLPLLLIWIKKKFLSQVILLVIVILTAYTSISMHIDQRNGSAYFSLLSRIPEFLVGAFYSLKFKNRINFNRVYNSIFASLNLVILVLSAFLIGKDSFFPGFLALIPTIATANLLVTDNNFISDFFAKKGPVYLGELSYSLYLWHWPVIAFIRYYHDAYFLSPGELILTCILTFMLAWLSYRFIENFFRKKSNTLLIRYSVAGSIIWAAIAFFVPKITAGYQIPEAYTSPTFGFRSHNEKVIEVFGDKTAENSNILLIGDSHAFTIKPYLDYIGKRNHFSFSTVTTDGVPALQGIKREDYRANEVKFYDSTQKLVAFTQQNIKKNRIIMINCSSFIEPPSVYSALEKLAASLRPDQKLVVFSTFPSLDRDPVKVNRDYIKRTSASFKIISKEKNKIALEKLAAAHKNVFLYDLSKGNVLKNVPFYKDTLMYYNASHLNTYGSVSLGKEQEKDFMSFFRPIMSGK